MEQVAIFINENVTLIYLLVFMVILGFQIISNVPTILHTPLMSGANAVSGIVIIGGILLLRKTNPEDIFTIIVGVIAIILGMINVMGGFYVTNRMLSMFKKKK
ncbi:MAG: NAD(P) transhydrogenase subunit alpha [Saprospiraceae bacterium]|jgi:NAD(P) transhydrogenase subunit alpha|nr:NAD(P) transhydrogenase subunit alpha [Saprospiraceae bacterium]MBP9196446.1 NAD(P) transhydrogenase subunit alpha [Saprospiraceae bacterium]